MYITHNLSKIREQSQKCYLEIIKYLLYICFIFSFNYTLHVYSKYRWSYNTPRLRRQIVYRALICLQKNCAQLRSVKGPMTSKPNTQCLYLYSYCCYLYEVFVYRRFKAITYALRQGYETYIEQSY